MVITQTDRLAVLAPVAAGGQFEISKFEDSARSTSLRAGSAADTDFMLFYFRHNFFINRMLKQIIEV